MHAMARAVVDATEAERAELAAATAEERLLETLRIVDADEVTAKDGPCC